MGLEDVAWAKIEDAKGSAKGIPQLFQTLAGKDKKKAAKAGLDLGRRLFHEGRIFPATVAAVPFFLQLLAAKDVHHKELLLRNLGFVAVGAHHALLTTGFDQRARAARFSGPDGALHKDGYEAVRAGLPVYLDLLGDRSVEIRSQTAFLLAWLSDDAEAVLPALAKRLTAEKNSAVLASVVIAAGLATRYLHESGKPAPTPPILPDHSSPTVRFASGAALDYVARDSVDAKAVNLIAAGGEESVEESEFPWDDGDVWRYSDRLLIALSVALPAEVGAAHRARLIKRPRGLALLLPRYFRPSGDRPDAAALTPVQRVIADAIADHDSFWLDYGELSLELPSYGLPDDPASFAEWLGREVKKSPLERPLPSLPGHEGTVRHAILAVSDDTARVPALLAALVKDLSPEDLRDAIVHAVTEAQTQSSGLRELALAALEHLRDKTPVLFDELARSVEADGPPKILVDGLFNRSMNLVAYLAVVISRSQPSGDLPKTAAKLAADLFEYGYVPEVLREVFARLPEKTREKLVLAAEHDSGDPLAGPWFFYDLVPTRAVREKVVESIADWPKKFNEDKSWAVRAVATVMAPAEIEERSKDKKQPHRDVFVAALERLSRGSGDGTLTSAPSTKARGK